MRKNPLGSLFFYFFLTLSTIIYIHFFISVLCVCLAAFFWRLNVKNDINSQKFNVNLIFFLIINSVNLFWWNFIINKRELVLINIKIFKYFFSLLLIFYFFVHLYLFFMLWYIFLFFHIFIHFFLHSYSCFSVINFIWCSSIFSSRSWML